MAVFTPLSSADAARVVAAMGLGDAIGELRRVLPVAAGSVNSNFFLEGSRGRVFFRIYEEQEVAGVAYEWALLDHLRSEGLAVPRRLGVAPPGAVRVDGKPTAAFTVVDGRMSCQRGVSAARLRALGTFLGQVHAAPFGWRREGRFRPPDVRRRLTTIPADGELGSVRGELAATLDAVEAAWPRGLPRGVTHGDLFRDNALWSGDTLRGVLDWESAAEDWLAYDLAVTLLAWCCGEELDWELARALLDAYERVRPLTEAERAAFGVLALAAAVRFTVTRITDFQLRRADGSRVHKDYRRFLMRVRALRALGAEGLRARLAL